jgi:hypothetical protein
MPGSQESQPVKYAFLDVVDFSRNRSTEAQADIVRVLNTTVLTAVEKLGLHPQDQSEIIFLPTGDGICIAILQYWSPLDIHLSLAREILSLIVAHNTETPEQMRQFQVRIGLNQNVDNIIEDINGNRNVAGAGINTAQRIMNLADGGQILVGESVFEILRYREKYMKFFRRFSGPVKHGVVLRAYQYVASDTAGLNTETPSAFVQPVAEVKPAKPLTLYQAYYMADAIRHRTRLARIPRLSNTHHAAAILLHLLATDAVEIRTTPETTQPILVTHGAPLSTSKLTFEDQLKYYDDQDTWVCGAAVRHIETLLEGTEDCFEDHLGRTALFVSEAGKARLLTDHPDIWKALQDG